MAKADAAARDEIAAQGVSVSSATAVVRSRVVNDSNTGHPCTSGRVIVMGRDDARDLAITMVAAYEGAALLSNSLHDAEILVEHAARLTRWLDELPTGEPAR